MGTKKKNTRPDQNGQEDVERPERQSVSVKTKIETVEEGEIDVRKEIVKKKRNQELLSLG